MIHDAEQMQAPENAFPATSFLCPSERDIVLAMLVTSVLL
jgi:hypothetical protein